MSHTKSAGELFTAKGGWALVSHQDTHTHTMILGGFGNNGPFRKKSIESWVAEDSTLDQPGLVQVEVSFD